MILPVRERAKLGSPPLEFTNNPNESSNSVVKHWVGFRKSSWPAFVQKLQKLVEAQLSEADKALYGCGNYSLASKFEKFEVDAVTWHRMSPSQRKSHLRKMAVSMDEYVSRTKLSVSFTDVKASTILTASLQGIWEKVERLLNTPDAIVTAPGHTSAFMVASDSS
jgi:hypothetical protein